MQHAEDKRMLMLTYLGRVGVSISWLERVSSQLNDCEIQTGFAKRKSHKPRITPTDGLESG